MTEQAGHGTGPSPSTTVSQDPIASLPEVPDVRRTSAVATQIGTVAAVLADPVVRAKTRADVEAAALLDAMGPPQDSLPDWRIVEPPMPQVLLGHYRFAARRIGVPWSYLAAIHLVETRMGRIRGVSSAGALGPMQFLPTTWDLYGEGGDRHGRRPLALQPVGQLRRRGHPLRRAGGAVGALLPWVLALGGCSTKHVRGSYVPIPAYRPRTVHLDDRLSSAGDCGEGHGAARRRR